MLEKLENAIAYLEKNSKAVVKENAEWGNSYTATDLLKIKKFLELANSGNLKIDYADWVDSEDLEPIAKEF